MAAKSGSYNYFFYVFSAAIFILAYIRHSVHGDPYKCNAIMTEGSWLDGASSNRPTVFKTWQPEGCMIRPYNNKGVASCLNTGNGKGGVFIGDSTVREVFWATARKLNATAAATQEAAVTDKHKDITFVDGKTTLSFLWDPMLKSAELAQYLDASRGNANDADHTALPMNRALVVVGAGLWFAKDSRHPVDDFSKAMDKIALPSQPPYHGFANNEPGANRIFFLPVQPPLYASLDATHKASLKKMDIDGMNKYMKDLPTIYGVDVLLSFLDMVDDEPLAYQPNGLHVMNSVSDKQADVILNLRCNQNYRDYTYSGTCCYDYPVAWDSIAMWMAGIVLILVLAWVELQAWVGTASEGQLATHKARMPLLRALLVMWAMLCYCYLADRTQLFEKLHKLYNNQDFFLFCAIIALAGGLTIRRSASPMRPGQEKPTVIDQPFLSRDQTDEWKGWMQVAILAYHYTGASKILWIYKLIRLMVASYLFMTGYGHAAYFYQKADFSFKRVVAVNLRINLLSIVLPWMTNADYMFYYFAPLVTYWYAVVWLTMRIKSDWNQNLAFFLTKIACACACTSFLHTQPQLLDPVFSVINTVFGSRWDAKEWLFRCALDQFIVYTGMVVAVLYIRSSKPPAPPPPPQDPMGMTAHTRPGMSPHLRRTFFFVGSGACLVVYSIASATRTTKSSSNALHTYISPLAILAFIHLRNCTKGLRNHYSTAYAWVGKISLETFILQYHLWLAADTKGLLSLGIFGDGEMADGRTIAGAGMGMGRWLDCVVLGVLFVWVSYRVSDATGVITGAAMKALFK